MNRLRVAPTKSNLLALRRQLAMLEQGQAMLERKRELLTRLVHERLSGYRTLREQTRATLVEAWHWLAIATLRHGQPVLQQAALIDSPGLSLEILPRSALGVRYPSLRATRLKMKPAGLLGTDASLDEARTQMTGLALKLARLSEAGTALSRLIGEQRKAQKRVNALRYNIIPRYRDGIARIEAALEEDERNTLFQIKLLREKMSSAQNG